VIVTPDKPGDAAPTPRVLGNLLVAGGGTGGHLFPGIAVADEWCARSPENRVLFAGTGKAFEKDALGRAGYPHRAIVSAGIKGLGLWRKIKAAAMVPVGMLQSAVMIIRFRPSVVLGVGGYSSGPVTLAAWLMRIPVVLHEQNSIPGITNRLMAGRARRVYTSFPDTHFAARGVRPVITGNPVRSGFARADMAEESASGSFRVLVIGGSQGAHAINVAVIDSLAHLPAPEKIHFVHQTGPSDEAMVQDAYGAAGVPHEASAFFHDMPARYRQADLVICRAGATTIAEVTAMGRAVIFIPFPHAADNHQVVNAGRLVERQAAEMIEEHEVDGAILASRVAYYMAHPDRRQRMADNARALGHPEAAAAIVDDIAREVLTPA
jgi:UDP-N-acetylglucosamine--N-acetylmuramyl-(pentapeptide) pyrophosphoryl-undecaprenol N-acetylglucosamine transferase